MPSSTYKTALREIYSLDKFGSQLGLERISQMLQLLGNPQQKYRCILVAGSNGKGSTVEMLGSILRAQGLKVGTYFSPQVEEFSERIRINGRNAGENEIAEAYLKVKKICREHSIKATFFEVVTAMALLIFSWRKVDAAVLEVGLGGRLDATNAVEPEISAITSISLEHTGLLGSTEGEIAHEKCGIARMGMPLVVGQVNEAVKQAIEKECESSGAKPIFVSGQMDISGLKSKASRYSFKASFSGKKYSISLSAPGKFQVSNACVALAAAHLFGAKKGAIEAGLKKAEPKYRLQKISSYPLVIADCCHNPGAAFAIASELRPMQGKKILLFGAMKDKEYQKVLDILRPFFEKTVLTEVSLPRAARLRDLELAAASARISAVAVKTPAHALREAKRLAGKKGTVVIAGSIYLLGELLGKDKITIAQ